MKKKKTSVRMNRPIYLGLAILSLSKVLIYEYWYDEMKPKYGDRIRLCYMDTDSFVMHIKTKDCYEDIVDDVEKSMIHQIILLKDHYQWVKIRKKLVL